MSSLPNSRLLFPSVNNLGRFLPDSFRRCKRDACPLFQILSNPNLKVNNHVLNHRSQPRLQPRIQNSIAGGCTHVVPRPHQNLPSCGDVVRQRHGSAIQELLILWGDFSPTGLSVSIACCAYGASLPIQQLSRRKS